MNKWERAQLRRAIEAEKYIQSPQYADMMEADRKRRQEADINAGHSPKCSLNRCHADCPKEAAVQKATGGQS